MISEFTRGEMILAVTNSSDYRTGNQRKNLQVSYDKMINELSEHFFSDICYSRINFRQKMNQIDLEPLSENTLPVVDRIKEMTKNEILLFSRDYRDLSTDIEEFLEVYIKPLLDSIKNA